MPRVLLWCCCVALLSCRPRADAWTVGFEPCSSYVSPRAADLNGDGVKDIVWGGGGDREWDPSPYGVVALDGRDGSVLWQVPCRNQLCSTPLLIDLTHDSTPDVVMGGRSAQLCAIDGRSGRLLWSYLDTLPPGDPRSDTTILNFFTPLPVPDQDGDQLPDLICAYGGFVAAPAHDPDRPVGWLRLISAATGRLLAQAPMPDGAETYLSPVLWPVAPQPLIVFGSGGETLPGGLYVAPLADLLDGRFDSARCLARGDTRGFIAAPTLADTDGDGAVDLLVQAYDGSVWAFDGRSQALRWRMDPGPGYESHVRPVWLGAALPGQVLVTLNRAAWPAAGGAVQWLLDAATGAARPLDSLGNWQMATPVWQGSAAPTLFYTINEQRATGHAFETGLPAHTYVCRLVAWQWPGPRRRWLDEAPGINLGADVLVEDIDGDGHTELIWLHNRHPYDIDRFGGVRVSLRRL